MSFPTLQADARQIPGQRTGPKNSTSEQSSRSEKRNSSGLGVVVVPIHDDAPDISVAFSAIAKDVSKTGIGVIASSSISTPEVVICLSDKPSVKLFRGLIHHSKELGQGWFRFGVKVTKVLDSSEYPELTRFVASIMR